MHTSSSAIAESRRPHAGKLSQASLIHQSDERLVTLARSGSERAWAEISRRYGRQLRVYCTRFVGASRAEDAVQQTLLQAFLSLRDGTNREIVLRAWLYRIAHNCSIDLLRKGTADYDELDLEFDGVAQPPTLFEQREEIRRLVARMRDLPEAQRQALALRELEGRSYEEISAQLGHTGSGVRQLIFRARTALRNSAAAIMPLGFLKARFAQPLSAECHHVATAAAGPASSGPGLDAVGAATLAVVAALGGGLAAADRDQRRARPAHTLRTSVSPPLSVGTPGAGVSVAAPVPTGGTSARPSRRDEPETAAPVPLAPAATPVAAAPPAPSAPAPAPVADSFSAPPTAAPATPVDDISPMSAPAAPAGGSATDVSQSTPTVTKPAGPVPASGQVIATQPAPAKSAPAVPAKPVPAKQPVKAPPQPAKPSPAAGKPAPGKPAAPKAPVKPAPVVQKPSPKGTPAKAPARPAPRR